MGRKAEINPKLGISDGKMRSRLRSALRKEWGFTARQQFIKSVRVPNTDGGRHKYVVICSECKRKMKINEKEKRIKKDGTLTKKEKIVYEVDHVTNNPPLTIENLGEYVNHLLFSEMRILCWECHSKKTNK